MPKQTQQERFSEKVFPYMLSNRCPDLFSFNDCKFKIQKSKEGTGRIVTWRSGIVNAYTLEASFSGTLLNDRERTHLNLNDLENMGKQVCLTLLDLKNEQKFASALNKVQDFTKKQIIEKVIKNSKKKIDNATFDKLLTSIDVDDINNSDYESDTSGSDSSNDDRLPAGLDQTNSTLLQKSRKEKFDQQNELDSKSKRSIAFERISSMIKNETNQVRKRSKIPYQPSNTNVGSEKKVLLTYGKLPSTRRELRMSKIERVTSVNSAMKFNRDTDSTGWFV